MIFLWELSPISKYCVLYSPLVDNAAGKRIPEAEDVYLRGRAGAFLMGEAGVTVNAG